MSVRVPPELRAWLVDYALMRGVAVGAIVVAALEDFRELCAVGVPDLPAGDGRSVGVGRVRGAGSRATSSPGAPAASSRPAAGAPASDVAETVAEMRADVERQGRETCAGLADVVTGTGPRSTARAVPEAVRARQERLNKAKGMR